MHVTDFCVEQTGAFAACHFQNVQHGLLVESGKAGNGTDAQALNQKVNDLTGLFEVHAERVKWLRFAHGFTAPDAAIALHDAVVILETTEFLGFTIAAMTRHLILSGFRFIVTVNPQDSVFRLRPFDAKPLVLQAPAASLFICLT